MKALLIWEFNLRFKSVFASPKEISAAITQSGP
jgi:hypothetical protein